MDINEEEFRVIPGYEFYDVTRNGIVRSVERNIILSQYMLNGYLIVDTFRGSKTETLPVHRAVALAWVINSKPDEFNMVNHIDGDPLNNWYENLEWIDCSGNNYHAVNNGLRSDNICCRTRDVFTGIVTEHSSMAQAAEFMGMSKDTPAHRLAPKMFGRLVNGRFEFKYSNDTSSWFYSDKVIFSGPTRYMVTVTEPTGRVREFYSRETLVKEYLIYEGRKKSVPAVVEMAVAMYPEYKFVLRDSFTEYRERVRRQTRASIRMTIQAIKGEETLMFNSLTRCARHFGVDRSSISGRLCGQKDLNGWTFIEVKSAPLPSDG